MALYSCSLACFLVPCTDKDTIPVRAQTHEKRYPGREQQVHISSGTGNNNYVELPTRGSFQSAANCTPQPHAAALAPHHPLLPSPPAHLHVVTLRGGHLQARNAHTLSKCGNQRSRPAWRALRLAACHSTSEAQRYATEADPVKAPFLMPTGGP